MPLITDWLMLSITAIYVIATVFICVFNGRSARATYKQIEESQRQFEERKRLEYRPYFDAAPVDDILGQNNYDSDTLLFLSDEHPRECTILSEWIMMKNIGAGTAINLTCHWKNKNKEEQTVEFPFATFEKGEMRNVAIHIQVEFLPQYSAYEAQASLVLHFQDLLGNKYEQEMIIFFDVSSANNTKLRNMEVNTPKLTY